MMPSFCLRAFTLVLAALPCAAQGLRFEISFSEDARSEPVTGRVYAVVTRDDGRPPVFQVSETGVPFFGRNVEELRPGDAATIGPDVLGYPVPSTAQLPAGEYTVQAFVNVYTRFDRADGHSVWLHADQGEGQSWRRSPGNLYCEPFRVVLDPESDQVVPLVCDQVIAPIEPLEDTDRVKRIRIRSELLSAWWGTDMFLGATVLLPAGFEDFPEARYPLAISQGHFSTRAPGGYGGRRGSFTEWWHADDTPRFLLATIQHATPYYDDSYGVNSENSGPWGDAIVQELIPEIERRFRGIGEGWSRLLTGGSTGGWIALAEQVFYPEEFGGCWALCPDAVDFRYHQIVDIYDDANAYWIEHEWTTVERPGFRRTDGNIGYMMKDENWLELVVGDRTRSGGQWDVWEATYGPVGADGYPARIWDKRTGVIDPEVASYWRENYDLRHILERDWAEIGPSLVGKIHVYVGDMDNYHLNMGVRMLQEFLERADPPYEGVVEFEPMAGHCWGPGIQETLLLMEEHLDARAPEGADLTSWRHPAAR